MRMILALTTMMALLSAGSWAAPKVVKAPKPAPTELQMNTDALADFKRTDKALTVVFTHVTQKLPPATSRKLKAAEKAWLIWRDAEAQYSASLEAEGGTLYPTAYNDARTDLTRQRIQHLKKISSNGTP
jgi:uncharacterized protein YecT (DUF1311 family)